MFIPGGMDILNFGDVDYDVDDSLEWGYDEYYKQEEKYMHVADAMCGILEEVYMNKYAIRLISEKEGATEQVKEAISKMLSLRKLINGLYAEDINGHNEGDCNEGDL